MAKPTVYPDWAVNSDGTDHDVTDPTSGQNNVVAPDSTKKLSGWNFDETPPRQHFNWLSRLATQWIRWLDDLTTSHADILARDIVLEGACPNSTTLGINLPTGFTQDNTVILGGNLFYMGVNSVKYPLSWYGLNGSDTSYISAKIDYSPDRLTITFFEGSGLMNLNNWHYRIILRRTT